MAIQTIPYYDRQRDWRELALCKDTSPELFPIGNTGSALDAISLAKMFALGAHLKLSAWSMRLTLPG